MNSLVGTGALPIDTDQSHNYYSTGAHDDDPNIQVLLQNFALGTNTYTCTYTCTHAPRTTFLI